MAARRAGGRARNHSPPAPVAGGGEDGGKAGETEPTYDVRHTMAHAPTARQRYKPSSINETHSTHGHRASHADSGMGGARYPPDARTRIRWTLSRRLDYRQGRRAAPARFSAGGTRAHGLRTRREPHSPVSKHRDGRADREP